MSDDPHSQRFRLAQRLHDLFLHELGEHIDLGLLLGPPEYARAVLSLCRGSGCAELVALGEEFQRATPAGHAALERASPEGAATGPSNRHGAALRLGQPHRVL